MSDNGFIRKPNSLLTHPLWISASGIQRRVLDWLLEHAAYKDEIHPKGVHLKKGQVLFTISQIAKDEGFSKDVIQGAIFHFFALSTRGKPTCNEPAPILRNQIRNEFRNQFTILDILLEGYFISIPKRIPKRIPNQIRNESETRASVMYIDNEDDKTLAISKDISRTIVRDGGNVHNSQASFEHSPPSSNSFPDTQKTKRQNKNTAPAEPSLPPEDALFLRATILEEFTFAIRPFKGKKPTERDWKVWAALTKDNPDNILKAIFFYKQQEHNRIQQRGSYKNPAAFITTIIKRELWLKENDRQRAKKQDDALEERLKKYGAC